MLSRPILEKITKSNIKKQFLHLLDKHFNINQKYHKIFNYNYVKISYSCMGNMKNITRSYNKKDCYNEINDKTCNCRNKSNYPLDNKCLTNKNIYKADVKTSDVINELSTKF